MILPDKPHHSLGRQLWTTTTTTTTAMDSHEHMCTQHNLTQTKSDVVLYRVAGQFWRAQRRSHPHSHPVHVAPCKLACKPLTNFTQWAMGRYFGFWYDSLLCVGSCLLGHNFCMPLGGRQTSQTFWKHPALPRNFPELPQKFPSDFPGSPLTVDF